MTPSIEKKTEIVRRRRSKIEVILSQHKYEALMLRGWIFYLKVLDTYLNNPDVKILNSESGLGAKAANVLLKTFQAPLFNIWALFFSKKYFIFLNGDKATKFVYGWLLDLELIS